MTPSLVGRTIPEQTGEPARFQLLSLWDMIDFKASALFAIARRLAEMGGSVDSLQRAEDAVKAGFTL